MVSKIAPAGAKGTATGIYSTCQVLGVFGGGAMGGWLLQEQGANAVFLVNAVLIAIWLIVAWSMQPPSFLASVLIPLKGQDQQGLADKLRAVDGVAEVVIVASENTIYLKVDQRRVNRKQLAAIVDGSAEV
jgi:MFS family permease